ncbi:hypothetical protein BDV3_004203 [Batrachochytrium dendrobatidis]
MSNKHSINPPDSPDSHQADTGLKRKRKKYNDPPFDSSSTASCQAHVLSVANSITNDKDLFITAKNSDNASHVHHHTDNHQQSGFNNYMKGSIDSIQSQPETPEYHSQHQTSLNTTDCNAGSSMHTSHASQQHVPHNSHLLPQPNKPHPTQPTVSRNNMPLFWPTIHMDVTEQVGQFLRTSILRAQDMIAKKQSRFVSAIEIEVKLGRVCDKESRQRVQLPIRSETVMDNSGGHFAFQSNMTRDMHSLLNQKLNHVVGLPKSNVRYVHLYEEDQFFHVHGIGKVRKTINMKTKQVKCIISKVNVANLEVFLPQSPLDYRVSVNIEHHIENIDLLETPDFSRCKDRLSYSLTPFQVDLTQVKRTVESSYSTSVKIGEDLHEVEVEVNKPELLISEMEKDSRRQPNIYLDMVHALLTNARLLIRKSVPFIQQ